MGGKKNFEFNPKTLNIWNTIVTKLIVCSHFNCTDKIPIIWQRCTVCRGDDLTYYPARTSFGKGHKAKNLCMTLISLIKTYLMIYEFVNNYIECRLVETILIRHSIQWCTWYERRITQKWGYISKIPKQSEGPYGSATL